MREAPAAQRRLLLAQLLAAYCRAIDANCPGKRPASPSPALQLAAALTAAVIDVARDVCAALPPALLNMMRDTVSAFADAMLCSHPAVAVVARATGSTSSAADEEAPPPPSWCPIWEDRSRLCCSLQDGLLWHSFSLPCCSPHHIRICIGLARLLAVLEMHCSAAALFRSSTEAEPHEGGLFAKIEAAERLATPLTHQLRSARKDRSLPASLGDALLEVLIGARNVRAAILTERTSFRLPADLCSWMR